MVIRKTGEKSSEQKQIETIWLVIGLLTSIFTVIVGWRMSVSSAQESRINDVASTYTDIQSRLASIETNILWIKNTLK
jgi:hypothetical protein